MTGPRVTGRQVTGRRTRDNLAAGVVAVDRGAGDLAGAGVESVRVVEAAGGPVAAAIFRGEASLTAIVTGVGPPIKMASRIDPTRAGRTKVDPTKVDLTRAPTNKTVPSVKALPF